jgi:two-component system sensor histidine kinase HydH
MGAMESVGQSETLTQASINEIEKKPRPRFNLLRWFSVVSLLVIASVAIGLGLISTRFVISEAVQRDSLLTSQFVHAIASAEIRHADIPTSHTMAELLDTRRDLPVADVDPETRRKSRDEFLDHISSLPDALLVNVYAPDRVIIWSTNPVLIGKAILGNDDLEAAFRSRQRTGSAHHQTLRGQSEQKFLNPPDYLFIENYIPLFDAEEKDIQAIIEIYKEPKDLIASIERGYVVIWVSTGIGGMLIYLGLFWIVRRASRLLEYQQRQLINNEKFAALGEMSSAVAHSLRNPLATIRSSAELALEVVDPCAQKNINDIINQVDRMSKWVRELLLSLRPISGESEAVDLVICMQEVLQSYEQQIRRANIEVEFVRVKAPLVVSQRILLAQILNSLIANALEAMTKDGKLKVHIVSEPASGRVYLTVSDNGKGMSRQQEAMVFKPFFTTKQGGLGVGLVLVKRIMERFAGKVSLTSREQEGTRVKLTFKIAAGGEVDGAQHTGG